MLLTIKWYIVFKIKENKLTTNKAVVLVITDLIVSKQIYLNSAEAELSHTFLPPLEKKTKLKSSYT